jgi:hypothetical protein
MKPYWYPWFFSKKRCYKSQNAKKELHLTLRSPQEIFYNIWVFCHVKKTILIYNKS